MVINITYPLKTKRSIITISLVLVPIMENGCSFDTNVLVFYRFFKLTFNYFFN